MALGKEEEFYEDKSTLEGKLQDFICLCGDIDRDVYDEVAEAVFNAFKENGITVEIEITNDD